MKKLIFAFALLILLQSLQNVSAQWSPVKRLTYGFKDSNPSFNSLQNYYGTYTWEFMVFQRMIDASSQICVFRLDQAGPVDSVRYLTSNNFTNRNPCIAYRVGGFTDTIRTAFALWETNQNGRWDIYGSYYNSGTWTNPFPVDSSSGDKSNPQAIINNASEFGITYSKEGEIIYCRYNAALKTVISETNLTSSVSGISGRPVIGETNNGIYINFRSQKADSSYNIYSVRTSNSGLTWANFDTVSTTGNNSTLFVLRSWGNAQQVFESERYGRKRIYSFVRNGINSTTTDSVFSSQYFNYYGMKSWMFPLVFDSYISHVTAVVRKSNDSTKILFDAQNNFFYKDSVTIGDTSKNVTIALNNGMRRGWEYVFYAVFNKDTAAFSSLYYKTRIYTTGNITQTGNYISGNYNLHQNYPNPFNPTTKIKFDIPKQSDIKIIIFDAVGREVKNIAQNNMTAGSYEYEFNGESLSSGIYYFKLQTNEFSKTVKMVLMK